LETFNITKEEIKVATEKQQLYELLHEKRCQYFEKNYNETKKSIVTAKEYHDEAEKFLDALYNNDLKIAKETLLNYNRGVSSGSSNIAVLVDATGSMSSLLNQAKNTVSVMFDRISTILKDNKLDPKKFQIQFVAYRNYSAPESELLKYSGWCDDPIVLNKFLNGVPAAYGMGNEAIEVALQYINGDANVSEIIIIGDAGGNTKQEVTQRRQSCNGGEPYWTKTKFATPTYFEDEITILKSKGIKVNAFYLTNGTANKNDFAKMASETGGICEYLDIHSPNGAEILTGLVSKRVLNATGGDKLVKAYEQKFHV